MGSELTPASNGQAAGSAAASSLPRSRALDLRNVSMTFGTFKALTDVDFWVEQQEIVALLGENGCGKSTLVKVLAGVNTPDPGAQLLVGGRTVSLPLAPGGFRELGLSFVHQDLGLARTLTVLENLVVGTRSRQTGRPINWRAEERRVRAVLDEYQVDIDPARTIDDLPPVGQALVAIVRAAEELREFRSRDASRQSILFLDEPTVFLPESEMEFLFSLVRRVVAGGASAVLISHDLAAVRQLCDRAVVLRDGRVAGEAALDEVDDDALIDMIVGSTKGQLVRETGRRNDMVDRSAERALEVQGLRSGGARSVDFAVGAGEIVGIAGLLGSGAEDVPYACFGASRDSAGHMALGDERIDIGRLTPAVAVDHGLALVPADRRRDGIAPEATVGENMSVLVTKRFSRFGTLKLRQLRQRLREMTEEFDIRPREESAPIGRLSGGNQQKAVLAKWLEIEPRVLLLHEPTQGVDVAARAAIYRLVRDAADRGMAAVWVSSDFEELATVCDRILVMAGGEVRAELTGEAVSEERINSTVYRYSAGATDVLAATA